MAPITSERIERIHDLDKNYQHTLNRAAMLHGDENVRRVSLHALSLQDENAELKYIIGEKASYVESISSTVVILRQELSKLDSLARAQQTELKRQRVEMHSLKAETEVSKRIGRERDDAVNEKEAIAREIDRLQPEVQELMEKVSSHQDILSAKIELERRIQSLETELKNERLMRQQLDTKFGKIGAVQELRERLETAEKTMSQQKNERESLQLQLAEANAQWKRQEEQAIYLRAKLRELQSTTMKDRESERHEREEQSSTSQAKQTIYEKQRRQPVPKANKSKPTEMSFEDITIQTPGNECQDEKRATKQRADNNDLFGKKSTFSVTPFLSRTRDLERRTPDVLSDTCSPPLATHHQAADASPAIKDARDSSSPDQSPPLQLQHYNKARRKVNKPNKTAFAEKSDSDVNRSILRVSKPPPADTGPKKRVRLGTVTTTRTSNQEQENEGAADQIKGQDAPPTGTARTKETAPIATTLDGEVKTKKRKIFRATMNANLEDEEDFEVTQKMAAPIHLGPAKRIKAPLGRGVTNAFAGTGTNFSPLKRHKRGVNASFLG